MLAPLVRLVHLAPLVRLVRLAHLVRLVRLAPLVRRGELLVHPPFRRPVSARTHRGRRRYAILTVARLGDPAEVNSRSV